MNNSNLNDPNKEISKHFPNGQSFDLHIQATSPDNVRIDMNVEMEAQCTASVVSSIFLNFLHEDPKISRAIVRACDLYKRGVKSITE